MTRSAVICRDGVAGSFGPDCSSALPSDRSSTHQQRRWRDASAEQHLCYNICNLWHRLKFLFIYLFLTVAQGHPQVTGFKGGKLPPTIIIIIIIISIYNYVIMRRCLAAICETAKGQDPAKTLNRYQPFLLWSKKTARAFNILVGNERETRPDGTNDKSRQTCSVVSTARVMHQWKKPK